jgi:D-glycero-alpha-D-manno-heptose-7-phosphate kinase
MSPVRISFAGGGTDMPEYFEEYGGRVVTTSINHFTYVIINPRRDKLFQAFSLDYETHHKTTSYDILDPMNGTEIAVAVVKYLGYNEGANYLIGSDVQPGSGLGASSALTVNFVKILSTLKGENWSKEKIAENAFHIGRKILKYPIGKQDEYISSFGGFNLIKFEKDKVIVHPITFSKSTLQELEQNLLLFYAGYPKNHTKILEQQLHRIQDKTPETMESLHFVRNLAEELYDALTNSNITAVGELLHKGWQAKKKFVKSVSNERIDMIYETALKEGAVGGKVTGAGGGGHMLFYCESTKQ